MPTRRSFDRAPQELGEALVRELDSREDGTEHALVRAPWILDGVGPSGQIVAEKARVSGSTGPAALDHGEMTTLHREDQVRPPEVIGNEASGYVLRQVQAQLLAIRRAVGSAGLLSPTSKPADRTSNSGFRMTRSAAAKGLRQMFP